jgi:hypothetical protein
MNHSSRFVTLLPVIVAVAIMILGSTLIVAAKIGGQSNAATTEGHVGAPLLPAISEGGRVAVACEDVTTCTTGAITNVDAGDTLIVIVTEFTTSHGAPSAVVEVTAGGDQALSLLGSTPCASGSGHGVTAIYGLANVAAQASVTFTANYTTASYYTIHGLDVEGAAAAPFETAGAGVCSTAAGTTGTATVNTTAPDDLVILGVEVRASTTFAESGGDTLVTQAATTGADLDSGAMLDEVDASTGSISLSATFTSASWSAIAVALKTSPLVSGTVTPSTAAIDAGEAIELSTTAATGGTPPVAYQWYAATSTSSCTSGTVIGGATGLSYTTPALAIGTYYYCVWATDNSTPTNEVAYSNVANVSVDPALEVTVTPSAPSIESGQTVQLTANPSGGTGADSYAWYLGSSCSGTVLATSQVYTSPALTATTTYCVVVTDSSYLPSNASATVTVTVEGPISPLTVTIAPAAPSIDRGQSVTLTANPSGGTAPYTYAWYSGGACSGTELASTQAYTTSALTATTSYCVAATDSESSPVTATADVTVTVSASALSVTITPSAPTIDNGQTVALTANPSGGTGADSYAWYSGVTCSGTVLAVTKTYTTTALSANATYCVVATDSAYVPINATAHAAVTVTAVTSGPPGAPPPTGSSASPPSYVYPVLGVLAAALLAALLLALLARRSRKVKFLEMGLPEKTLWSMTLEGAALSSNDSSITFSTSKGEHPFVVKPVAGYVPTPASGTVKVGKDPSEVTITFSKSPP